jgi:hypothetical protein
MVGVMRRRDGGAKRDGYEGMSWRKDERREGKVPAKAPAMVGGCEGWMRE